MYNCVAMIGLLRDNSPGKHAEPRGGHGAEVPRSGPRSGPRRPKRPILVQPEEPSSRAKTRYWA